MKLTVGPLPPAVYWRRRAALGALVLAVVFGVSTCTGSGSDPAPQRTAQTAAAPTPTPTASASASAETTGGTSGGTAEAPQTEAPRPAAQAATQPVAPAPATRTEDRVSVCTNDQLQVTAVPQAKTLRYGTMPKLHLTVRNVGEAACRRDVGADMQELRVMAGTRRLWSSDDCQPLKGNSVRTLAPGEKRVYTVTWAGKDSVPGCQEVRRRLEPGTYQLVARLGSLVGKRTDFRIR
jgi:hypothetical protein